MKKQMFYEASGKIWRIPLFIGLFSLPLVCMDTQTGKRNLSQFN